MRRDEAAGIFKTFRALFIKPTILENLISALTNHTAQVMLEKVITETGMMDQVRGRPMLRGGCN